MGETMNEYSVLVVKRGGQRIILECTVQKEDGYAWSDYFVAGWEL